MLSAMSQRLGVCVRDRDLLCERCLRCDRQSARAKYIVDVTGVSANAGAQGTARIRAPDRRDVAQALVEARHRGHLWEDSCLDRYLEEQICKATSE